MIKIAATLEYGVYVVWCMLDDDDANSDPRERGESFVIAEGATLPIALDLARKELERVAGEIAVLEVDEQARNAVVVS